MINNQAYLLLIFILDGIVIGLLFDFFRILRKSFKTSNLVTYIEDILFWILTGFLVLYTIFIFNKGEIRFFIFIGIIMGIILYILFLSKYVIAINMYIINIFKNLTKSIKNLLKKLKKIGDFRNKDRIL